MARKLLPDKAGPKRTNQKRRGGSFRRMIPLEDGKLLRVPRKETVYDVGYTGYSDHGIEPKDHHLIDEHITQLLLQRAKRNGEDWIKEGKIRIVPNIFFRYTRKRKGGSVVTDKDGKAIEVMGAFGENRPGLTLDQFLRESSSSKDKKRVYMSLMRQIARLHSLDIVHKDVRKRPGGSNVLIWDGKNPHFSDFGLAVDLRRSDGNGLIHSAESDMLSSVDLFKDHLDRDSLEHGMDAYSTVLRRNSDRKNSDKIFQTIEKCKRPGGILT